MRGALRVILCGFVAGLVWHVLSGVLLSLFADEFLAAIQEVGHHPRRGPGFFFALDVLMGVWAIWLHSAIAPRYGSGTTTAVITGVAWWTIKSLQSVKWEGLGLLPPGVALVPLATTLVAAVAASLAGAFLYERTETTETTAPPRVPG